VISLQKLLVQTLISNGALKVGEFEEVLADFLRTMPSDVIGDPMYQPHRMLLAKLTENPKGRG
jgi:hypothetical protein